MIGLLGLYKLASSRGGHSLALVNTFKTIMGRDTLVYVPAGSSGDRVVVYFHGFSNSIRARGPRLIAAMKGVSSPPVFIMPQLVGNSEPGDLSTNFSMYLTEALGIAGITGKPEIDVVSHSGGYRATADAIKQVNVKSVALLDSLYGRYEDFRKFAKAPSTRYLIDIYGPTTAPLSKELAAATKGQSNVHVSTTTTPHDAIPEKYLADVLKTFAS